MSVIVITPPTAILDVATIRASLGLGATTPPTALLNALAAVAQGTIDGPRGSLGRSIGTQTLEYRLDAWERHKLVDNAYDPNRWRVKLSGPDWPSGGYQEIPLPFPPVQSITFITYLDTDGALQTLDPATYTLVGGGEGQSRVVANFSTSWPATQLSPEAIKVRFVAGYSTVPPELTQAMLLMVRNLLSLTSRDAALRSETVDGIGSRSFETSHLAGKSIDMAVEALIGRFRIASL